MSIPYLTENVQLNLNIMYLLYYVFIIFQYLLYFNIYYISIFIIFQYLLYFNIYYISIFIIFQYLLNNENTTTKIMKVDLVKVNVNPRDNAKVHLNERLC